MKSNLLSGYNKQYGQYFSKGEIRTPSVDIARLAELFLAKNSQVKLHIQNYDEFNCVVSGSATVYCDDEAIKISAGQVFFIRRGHHHRIATDGEDNLRYYCVGVTFHEEDPVVQTFLERIQDRDYFLMEDRYGLQPLFARLTGEIYAKDDHTCDMIHFAISPIFVLLCRAFDEQAAGSRGHISNNDVVYRVLRFVDREYMYISRVKEIADTLSYSEHYLSHVFKEKMDITLKEYLTQRKIAKATELLESDKLSITEVSNQLQFSSLHAFGLAFKRCVGVSPSQFRKHLQKKTEE